jgi:hypothetical protein
VRLRNEAKSNHNEKESEVRVFSMLMLVAVVPVLMHVAAAQQQSAANPLDLMKSVIIPASTAVFEVSNAAPKNDREWAAVEGGAAKLIDAAKVLAQQAPAAGGANWTRLSKAMSDAAATAGKAAKARNADAVVDAGDVLYTTCEDCHKQYMKR